MKRTHSGHVPPTTGTRAVGSSAAPERGRRGAPPKRGVESASSFIHLRVSADRKSHYTRFAKKRRDGDKTLAGLVIETLDVATGYREERERADFPLLPGSPGNHTLKNTQHEN